jgi:hypothetical protein
VLAFTSILTESAALTLSKKNLSTHAVYPWYLFDQADRFELMSTNTITDVLVTIDNWVTGTSNSSDPTTIICGGKQYVLYAGNALHCKLLQKSSLLIQDRNFQYGTTGTFEIIR